MSTGVKPPLVLARRDADDAFVEQRRQARGPGEGDPAVLGTASPGRCSCRSCRIAARRSTSRGSCRPRSRVVTLGAGLAGIEIGEERCDARRAAQEAAQAARGRGARRPRRRSGCRRSSRTRWCRTMPRNLKEKGSVTETVESSVSRSARAAAGHDRPVDAGRAVARARRARTRRPALCEVERVAPQRQVAFVLEHGDVADVREAVTSEASSHASPRRLRAPHAPRSRSGRRRAWCRRSDGRRPLGEGRRGPREAKRELTRRIRRSNLRTGSLGYSSRQFTKGFHVQADRAGSPRSSLLLLAPLAALGQRQPVLKQIQVPHHYYYREMYLPQVTSGPASVSLVARRPRAGLLDAGLALAAGARIAAQRGSSRTAPATTTSPTGRPTAASSPMRPTATTPWSCGCSSSPPDRAGR